MRGGRRLVALALRRLVALALLAGGAGALRPPAPRMSTKPVQRTMDVEYEAPRELLVCGKNGALVRTTVDPEDADSEVVGQLERYEAARAVGEVRLGAKTRLCLVAPCKGWASASVFVERRDVVARDDWAATRRRAEDLCGAGRFGGLRVLAADPLAFVVKDFATPSECDRIIEGATPLLSAALVAGDSAGERSGTSRSAQVAWVPRSPTNPWLAKRVAELVDLPLSHAESLQVVKYQPGGEYKAHFDAFPLESARGRRASVRGATYAGQRRVTAILYLNDVDAGGGTAFHCDTPDQFVVQPKRGQLFVFYNCFEDGQDRHPMSLHAGLPVDAGVKWIANIWWRSCPYQKASIAAPPGPPRRAADPPDPS